MPPTTSTLLWRLGGFATALAAGCATLGTSEERRYDECKADEKLQALLDGRRDKRDHADFFKPTPRWWEKAYELRHGNTGILLGTRFWCKTKPPETNPVVKSDGDQHQLLQERVEKTSCEAEISLDDNLFFKEGRLLGGHFTYRFERFERFKPVEPSKLELVSENSDSEIEFSGLMVFKGIEWHFYVDDDELFSLNSGLPRRLHASADDIFDRSDRQDSFTCELSESRRKLDLPPELKYDCYEEKGVVDPAVVRGVLTAYFAALQPTLLDPRPEATKTCHML